MKIQKKRIAFHTLGCKLNFTETSAISNLFPDNQFERVSPAQKADIYVINTCTVTDSADRKCRQAIKKFIHQSPGAFIAVAGCYAQLKPQELSSIPGVDLVLGNNEKFEIITYLSNTSKNKTPQVACRSLTSSDPFLNAFSAGDRTRAFLKVQDGCDYGCSYCTVPLARGSSRNADIKTLVREAEIIAAKGIKELVLTGVNIGDFGKSTGETFIALIKELAEVKDIERIRLSSIEPNLLSDDIIQVVKDNNKILPHFHIPLQSGSNRILRLMRRRYKREVFAARVELIRKMIPSAGIGADVITGFPGETIDDFEDTFRFIREQPLSYLHVFTFSDRPGTAAAEMPDRIDHKEKERRRRKLIALAEEKHMWFMEQNIGKTVKVLFEKTNQRGIISGFTGNYLRVAYPWQRELAGKIIPVLIKDIAGDGNLVIELIQNK